MRNIATPNGWTTVGTAEAVSLPRRHLLAVAILMCVPLPLLSLAATVVPLPQMLERATATFATLATPALGGDASVIRERTVAVGSVEIKYQPLEQPPATTTASSRGTGSQPTRDATSQVGSAPGKTITDAEGSGAAPVDPAGDTDDGAAEAATTGPGNGTTGQGQASTPGTDPGASPPAPAPKAEPPTSAGPAPSQGGGTGSSAGTGGTGGNGGTGGSKGTEGSGAGGSGTGGAGGSKDPGGGSGSKDPGGGSQVPPSGGSPPQDPGGGTTPPPAETGPGSGSGTPPESPPSSKGGGGGSGRP
jgi:hypothetical protein